MRAELPMVKNDFMKPNVLAAELWRGPKARLLQSRHAEFTPRMTDEGAVSSKSLGLLLKPYRPKISFNPFFLQPGNGKLLVDFVVIPKPFLADIGQGK